MLATEQLVHRNANLLSDDVVKGKVDCRYGSSESSTTFEVLAAVHLLPEPTAPHGIATNQELSIVLNDSLDPEFSTGESRFSPTVDTFVGFDFYEHLVSTTDPDSKRFYISNFHCFVPFRWSRLSTSWCVIRRFASGEAFLNT